MSNREEILTKGIKEEKNKGFRIFLDILLPILVISIPVLVFFFIFRQNGFYPFNESGSTILMIDGQGQYIAYFRYFKYLLLNNEQGIYTLSKTIGGDFLSIYSYYLASPFNFLIVLFKDENIPLFMLLVSLLKMALASLNMYLLLRFSDNKKPILGHLIFAVGYGLCSYSFVYLFSPMWLDGVMILPLVVLGIRKLLYENKMWLYPLALAYALISSWYIGFMICVFSLLFFFTMYFGENNSINKTKVFSKTSIPKFFLYSLIGGLIAAFMWATAFLHLSGTKASVSFSRNGFVINFATLITGGLSNNYTSSETITRYGGYITFFTSVITLIFFILFFFSKQYKLRERISYLLLVVLFGLIACIAPLDTLMHGGSVPTWFPARYSFLIAFLLSYLGNKAFVGFKKIPTWSFIFVLLASITLFVVVLKVPNSMGNVYTIDTIQTIIFFGSILLLFAVSILYTLKFDKVGNITLAAFSLILTPASVVSSYLSENNVVKLNVEQGRLQNQNTYLNDCAFQQEVDKIKLLDNSLYRMENNFVRSGSYNNADNDPMFYSFNGLSHYSSSEKSEVMSYMKKIGFHYNGFNEGYYLGSTLSMNSLLGVKYLISNEDNKHSNFASNSLEKLDDLSTEKYTFYKNKYALPFGFAINRYSATFINEGVREENGKIRWFDHFEYQNEMFKAITDKVVDSSGKKKDIFKKIPVSSITPSSGLTYTENEYGDKFYTGPNGGSISIDFTIPDEAIGNNLYFWLKDVNSDISTSLDYINYSTTSYWESGIASFDDNSSHHHTLRLYLNKAYSNRRIQEEIYYEDISVLNEYIEAIKEQSSLDLNEGRGLFSYYLQGTFTLDSSNQDFLFTIPFEKNVKVKIDGVAVDTYQRHNIFTAGQITSTKNGKHSIEIEYTDTGLMYGSIASLVGVSLYILFAILSHRRRYR